MEQYLLRQHSDKTCGLAVAKMFLAYETKKKKALLLDISEELDNFLRIKRFLELNGLFVEGRKVTNFCDICTLRKAMIIQVKKDDKFHFLLIKRKNKRYFKVNDPGYGHYLMTKESLDLIFTGYYLINKDRRRHQPLTGSTIQAPLTKHATISFIFFYVLSLILLGLGILIFDKITLLPFSISLSSFSIIAYILSREILFKLSHDYDDSISETLALKSEDNFINAYKECHLIKKDILESKMRFITATLTSIFLIVLLLINDHKMLLVIVFILLSLLHDRELHKKKQYQYLKHEEDIYHLRKNVPNKIGILRKLNNESSSFISRYFYKTIIYDALTIFILLLIMLMNELLSLNYILLYFFLCQYLRSNLATLINWKGAYSTVISRINQLHWLSRNH